MSKILVVDDERAPRRGVSVTIKKMGHVVMEASCTASAIELVEKNRFDLVITDMRMPERDGLPQDEESGLQVIKAIKRISPETQIIVMTAYGSIENAVLAMKEGAWDYVVKPFSMEEIKLKVKSALQQNHLIKQNIYLKEELRANFGEMVGRSEEMKAVYQAIRDVSQSDVPVLIRGETGTGKELVARAIHDNSSRRKHMFVAVNVGAMVSTLIESELFGHEKGAFTGATSQRVGKFELANNGTLFLDEIGELTPELQIKFLRVLQHQEFQRVGGTSIISTDARIIAATNQNLEEKIKNGSFRQDLYYRLNVFPIYLPPLRKRKDDIPDLVHYFIKKYNKKFAKSIRNVTRDAMEVLLGYDWPGNVRELENIVQRMMIKCKGERMGVDEIPFEILSSGNLRLRSTEAALENFIDALITTHDFEGDIPLFEKIESSVARRMMKRWGKKRDVMEKLKISAPTLDKLLKR